MQNSFATVRCGYILALAWFATAANVQGAMRMEVLRGDGANNNAAQGLGTSPAVRVLDARGQPAPKVLVVFSAPDSGASVQFAGEGPSATVLTDESGVAVAPHFRPTGGNGPVEIRVMANLAGEFVNAVIHQMNLGTGGDPHPERELSLVKLPEASGIAVRVEDGTGRAVPSATVVFALRKVNANGKTEELSRSVTTSSVDGQARAAAPRRSGNSRLEFMVQAESDGRRSTDYFRVD
jgi:hypothetical protein